MSTASTPALFEYKETQNRFMAISTVETYVQRLFEQVRKKKHDKNDHTIAAGCRSSACHVKFDRVCRWPGLGPPRPLRSLASFFRFGGALGVMIDQGIASCLKNKRVRETRWCA